MLAMRQAARAAGAARTGDPCCGSGMVAGRFGHRADGSARHRFNFGASFMAEIGDLSPFFSNRRAN